MKNKLFSFIIFLIASLNIYSVAATEPGAIKAKYSFKKGAKNYEAMQKLKANRNY